ncbi:MAG: biotin--[acetyl-CoA-carboxylase] ligase [Porphyromonadaceae bacterium CG2_30_38_12]|nr:MAG: biotin--[acetyl-CoA-carboxylase] ligase [Porphyromonadaceae bacterium CG2_30_38_12]
MATQTYCFIKETGSTNTTLKSLLKTSQLPDFFVLRTSFQTLGRGQMGNWWEAEKGKNLLCSIVHYPMHINLAEQFILSQQTSLAIKYVLDTYVDNVTIKWPNDIYCGDKKIGGILIENSIQGNRLAYSIIGIGININQVDFRSAALNPTSIYQLTNKRHQIRPILQAIVKQLKALCFTEDAASIHHQYFKALYRNSGYHSFKLPHNDEIFCAKIAQVAADGKLTLEHKDGRLQSFYFKEIEFVIQ